MKYTITSTPDTTKTDAKSYNRFKAGAILYGLLCKAMQDYLTFAHTVSESPTTSQRFKNYEDAVRVMNEQGRLVAEWNWSYNGSVRTSSDKCEGCEMLAAANLEALWTIAKWLKEDANTLRK